MPTRPKLLDTEIFVYVRLTVDTDNIVDISDPGNYDPHPDLDAILDGNFVDYKILDAPKKTPPENPVTYACPKCGEQALYASEDVTLWWDRETQAWDVSDDSYPTQDTTLFCAECETACNHDDALLKVK